MSFGDKISGVYVAKAIEIKFRNIPLYDDFKRGMNVCPLRCACVCGGIYTGRGAERVCKTQRYHYNINKIGYV